MDFNISILKIKKTFIMYRVNLLFPISILQNTEQIISFNEPAFQCGMLNYRLRIAMLAIQYSVHFTAVKNLSVYLFSARSIWLPTHNT